MHIAIVAPVNISSFADVLDTASAIRAQAVAPATGTAPTSLALALVEAGHTVSVITHQRGEPSLVLTGDRLRIVRVRSRNRAREQVVDCWKHERSDMTKALLDLAPDVVHAHWAYEWALAALASDLPTAITVRDAPLTVLRYEPSLYRLVRLSLAINTRLRSSRAAFAAPSPYLADLWQKQMLSRSPVRVIPNMSPTDMGCNTPKARHPLSVEVADNGARKNLPKLLESFAYVRQDLPTSELRLIGHGLAHGGSLYEWARAQGYTDGVSFLGPLSRNEVSRHLASAWLHTHAATEETFGNTLVEAMMEGTAVLAGARSGAVPWVLDHGSAGHLTDVTDPRSMASDWTDLLQNDRQRSILADRGRQRAMAVFTPKNIVAKTLDLYNDALQRPE